MGWRNSHRDPRLLDLFAALALLLVIVAAWRVFEHGPAARSTAPFIVPSQDVRW